MVTLLLELCDHIAKRGILKHAHGLLTKLNELLPPTGGKRHNITLSDDGSMVVTLAMDRFWPFKLKDDDLLRVGESVALEIVDIYKSAENEEL